MDTWSPSTARYGGYLGQNQFGQDPVDRRNMDNYALFSAGGTDYLVLNLEWEAPQYALDWADKVLAAYPDRTVIMTTHGFVSTTGVLWTTPDRPDGTAPAKIWSSFVSTHCQIKAVFNGHEFNGNLGEARRSDVNACGQPVQEILTDYQGRPNGGDGWLRYYTFDPSAGTMTATTYSPTLDQYETDADSQFTVPFPFATQVPAPFTTIGSVTVPSGGTATTTWTSLAEDTAYEWRAVVSDGASQATSNVWTIRTAPKPVVLSDSFARTVTSGWGAADTGQQWSAGSASGFSVTGDKGAITFAKGSGGAIRPSNVALADAVIEADVIHATKPGGSGTYVSLIGREVGPLSYRAEIVYTSSGTTTLMLVKSVGGLDSLLAQAQLPNMLAVGAPLRVRFETVGASPTTVRAKAWPVAGSEPSGWSVTATDATADLQGQGGVGLDVYISSGSTISQTVQLTHFSVTRSGTTAPPANAAPTAVISSPTIDQHSVAASGVSSFDPDGSVVAWHWTFGDGGSADGASVTHTYQADGTYQITLTVTDNSGATASVIRSVTVMAPTANKPPVAMIGAPVCTALSCSFDGSMSSDPDGTVSAYAWSFGDAANGASTAAKPSYTYAAAGAYTVKLTVTDNAGATASTTRSLMVAGANRPPVAVISPPTVDGLLLSVSGSGSTDADGSVTVWAWDFGDGGTASGASASHAYAAAGSYLVSLVVTDDQGAVSGTATATVVVALPVGGEVVARDAFSRTVSPGWGTADLGGPWSRDGSATPFSVSAGVGRQTLTSGGMSAEATLSAVSVTAAEVRVSMSFSRTGSSGTLYAALAPRVLTEDDDYRVQVSVGSNNRPELQVLRRLDGDEVVLGSVSLSTAIEANNAYAFVVRTTPSGTSTAISAKFWPTSSIEPTNWQVSATDNTPLLQNAGAVKLASYMSRSATAPIATSFDDLSVTRL